MMMFICPMHLGWQWVARLPGDQWMRQSRRMGIEPSELCILTALAKLAWGVFWSTSIDPPVFNMFFGRLWGPVDVPVRNHLGRLLLLHFAAVLFRKGCVFMDFFPTCWALGLRCWSWIFGRPLMVWGQDTWRYEVRQRNRYAKDDHLGIGFKDLDHYHPYPWENDPNLTNAHIFQMDWGKTTNYI